MIVLGFIQLGDLSFQGDRFVPEISTLYRKYAQGSRGGMGYVWAVADVGKLIPGEPSDRSVA